MVTLRSSAPMGLRGLPSVPDHDSYDMREPGVSLYRHAEKLHLEHVEGIEVEVVLARVLDALDLFEATLRSVNVDTVRAAIWLWKGEKWLQQIDRPCRSLSR